MLSIFIVCLVVLAILLIAEFGCKQNLFANEIGRKSVHISVGTFVAFWPLFLSWPQIIGLSLAFVVVISLSRYFNIFSAIHSVQRPTWGEVYFAVTVGLLAFVTQDGWIYMAALLHMALADGLAAIMGVEFGERTKYKIFGHTKSIVGSLTFFAVSLAIIFWYGIANGVDIMPLTFIAIAASALFLENVSPKGIDNITVPLCVAFMLIQIS